MRNSIRDVAKLAQVSPKTVTNVLRGRDARTSAETRARVEQAVSELNYVPVRAATQNRVMETHIIGLIFDDMDAVQSFMGMETYLGLRQGALEQGYDLLSVLQTEPEWARGRPEAVFLDRRCDGYIFVNPQGRESTMEALLEQEIPVVSCYNVEVPGGVAAVTLDNARAMQLAVQHLVAKGHRRIAHLAGLKGHSDISQRNAAFRAAMREAGLGEYSDQVVYAGHHTDSGQMEAVASVLKLGVTAVVCDTTRVAQMLWQVAESQGLSLPHDLSITGIDDIPATRDNRITALSFSSQAIGHKAVELFAALKTGSREISGFETVPVHLVERESVTGPPKN